MDKLIMGIELGSTRIKSILADESANVVAQGSFEWENSYENGFWTYALDDIHQGLRTSYKKLNDDYKEKFGQDITEISAIGISAMMHGYLAFDEEDNLLVPFRTWRNTTTERAANELSELFSFNIPQRWSAAHFYQAVLDKEEHVKNVAFLTTLAGYIHYKLTGEKVLGVGDASGMFPIENGGYNAKMLEKFNALLRDKGADKNFEQILPTVRTAGECGGVLTKEGAKFLDPTGTLKPGSVFCPPEGDAGTGMVATNSVMPKTANVSAGTSAFLMAVLEKDLNNYYSEIDIVTTPSGSPVAMVHVNNFSSEINAWESLFEEVIALGGGRISKGRLFEELFKISCYSDENVGGLVGYNFLSGEPIASVKDGRPLFLRSPKGRLNLANFMQMQIYSALGTLAIGVNILKRENVKIDFVCGHGGFFKTEFVGQNALSAAVDAPVTVMKNAGEGGAWGVALLALFTLKGGVSLEEFLNDIFKDAQKSTVKADEKEKDKFGKFMSQYKKGLFIEQNAAEVI